MKFLIALAALVAAVSANPGIYHGLPDYHSRMARLNFGYPYVAPLLPVPVTETPEVAQKRIEHLRAHEDAKLGRVAIPAPLIAPVPVMEEPVVAKARAEHLAEVEKRVELTKAVAAGNTAVLDRSAELPVPVQDTPEVAIAKAQHLAHKDFVTGYGYGGYYGGARFLPYGFGGFHHADYAPYAYSQYEDLRRHAALFNPYNFGYSGIYNKFLPHAFY